MFSSWRKEENYLKCKMQLSVMKNENLNVTTRPTTLSLKLGWGAQKNEVEELKKDLHAQQSVIDFLCSTNDNVLTVSYEVSGLIAKKLKQYDNGSWTKELLVKAVEKMAPKSVHLYRKLSLSRLLFVKA